MSMYNIIRLGVRGHLGLKLRDGSTYLYVVVLAGHMTSASDRISTQMEQDLK